MTNDEIKVSYEGQEIQYYENQNYWVCDLFTKPAASLREAKERIDKKLAQEKKDAFKQFNVYVSRLGYEKSSWPLVKVTSVTDTGTEVWVTDGKTRNKFGSSYSTGSIPIYEDSPENKAIIDEIHLHEMAIKKASERINLITTKLKLHILQP